MKPIRFIGTGLTIATFAFIAFSGVGMFFGLKCGVIKSWHEYIGLAMVVFVLIHVFINFKPFKLYFKGASGAVICALVIASCGYGAYSAMGAKTAGGVNPKMIYMQMLNLNTQKIKGAFGTDEAKFAEFLAKKGVQNFDETLPLREAAKKYSLNEGELLGAILPNRGGKPEKK